MRGANAAFFKEKRGIEALLWDGFTHLVRCDLCCSGVRIRHSHIRRQQKYQLLCMPVHVGLINEHALDVQINNESSCMQACVRIFARKSWGYI